MSLQIDKQTLDKLAKLLTNENSEPFLVTEYIKSITSTYREFEEVYLKVYEHWFIYYTEYPSHLMLSFLTKSFERNNYITYEIRNLRFLVKLHEDGVFLSFKMFREEYNDACTNNFSLKRTHLFFRYSEKDLQLKLYNVFKSFIVNHGFFA